MAFNTTKMKFHRYLILQPTKCTSIYNLAHYEKRLDNPGLSFYHPGSTQNLSSFAQSIASSRTCHMEAKRYMYAYMFIPNDEVVL